MAEKGHQITLVSILPSNNPYMRKKEREKKMKEYSFWVTETYVGQNSLKEGKKKKKKKKPDVNESIGFKNHRKMDFLPHNIIDMAGKRRYWV